MRRVEVAAKFGITRQRVSQILKEPEGQRPRINHLRPFAPVCADGVVVVPFTGKYKRLADPTVQQRIRELTSEGRTCAEVAVLYQCTYHAIHRILQCTMARRTSGRPRKPSVVTPCVVSIGTRRHAALADATVQAEIQQSNLTNQQLAARYNASEHLIDRIRRGEEIGSAQLFRDRSVRNLAIIDDSKTHTNRQLQEKYGLGQSAIWRIAHGQSLASALVAART